MRKLKGIKRGLKGILWVLKGILGKSWNFVRDNIIVCDTVQSQSDKKN